MIIPGVYFDGRTATAHQIHLICKGKVLQLLGDGIDLLIPTKQVKLAEPFHYASAMLDLGNGAHCEFQENQGSLQHALHYQPSSVERWQSKWFAALVAIVAMVGLLFCAYYFGVPKLAAVVADRIPTSVESQIGSEMIPVLDKSVFTPTGLSDSRMQQAQAIFDGIKPQHPRMAMKLIFRSAPRLGPNAIALPGGTIVVTDQMISALTGTKGDLSGDAAKELAGVFAHEMGHVELKHALKSLLSNSALTVLAASLYGDFSAIVTAIPVVIVGSEYSRTMESEADIYAIQLLHQHGISTSYMAKMFELLHKKSVNNAFQKMPRWMRFATDFTASHPSDEERIKRFRDAASNEPPIAPENEQSGVAPPTGLAPATPAH